MTLSRRESILLIILSFVLINTLGVALVVLPLINQQNQTELLVETVKSDLNAKLQLIQSTANGQQKLDESKVYVRSMTQSFLPVMDPEEMDAYLHQLIRPFTSQWQMLSMQRYQVAAMSDASGETSTSILRSEVQVSLRASEEIAMLLVKAIEESGRFIGISELNVVKGTETVIHLTLVFYALDESVVDPDA